MKVEMFVEYYSFIVNGVKAFRNRNIFLPFLYFVKRNNCRYTPPELANFCLKFSVKKSGIIWIFLSTYWSELCPSIFCYFKDAEYCKIKDLMQKHDKKFF